MLGELVQTTAGKWITHPPTRCPNGHTLGPGEVLVGHRACLGHSGGHTTWSCRRCDQTVYGPQMNTHCTTLEGPATVRISNMTQIPTDGGPIVLEPLLSGSVAPTNSELTSETLEPQPGRGTASRFKPLARLSVSWCRPPW